MKEHIEREAVINRLSDMEKLVKKENTIDAIICAGIVHCCIDAVKEAPAADVVEVRHAHWVDHGRSSPPTCSNCGGRALLNYESDYCESTNCPHCGAKMDGCSNRIDMVKYGGVNDAAD